MISREEILNIANLSKLYLDESEIENVGKEIEGMIKFANEINNLDESVGETKISEEDSIKNAFHEDKIEKSYDRSEILKNVDGGKDGFFYVKKFN